MKENLNHLDNLRASEAEQGTLDFVEGCHRNITQLLSRIAEESQVAGPPVSPYPEGESLLFYALLHTDLL
jgi:hypothetical protein